MNTFKFWAVFAVGVAAGATVALIYAPQSGARTRKQLKRKLDDAADYVKGVGEDFGDRAGDAVSRGRDVVDDLVSSAQKAAQQAARRVTDFSL
ncbi:MAG TPA: YtxH domain-containing protein [Acidisarcina sp.]|nr:YtxH domain-containing protein [Acidisarcina sp.]